MDNNKYLYLLCGVPGSGKSTWTSNFYQRNFMNNIIRILSTDDIIMNIANIHNLTYNEVFSDITYSFAERMMFNLAKYAVERANVIIWDQTNLTPKSRAKKLNMIPATWNRYAVVFNTPEEEELAKRLSSRKGKDIPDGVMYNMKKSFVNPTKDEGFNRIFDSKEFSWG